MHAGNQAQVLALSQVHFTDRTFSSAWILCIFGLCHVTHGSKVKTPRASDDCPQHVVFSMALSCCSFLAWLSLSLWGQSTPAGSLFLTSGVSEGAYSWALLVWSEEISVLIEELYRNMFALMGAFDLPLKKITRYKE